MPRADSAGAAYGTCHRLVTDDEAGGGAALAPSGLQARRGRADMRSMKHIALSADFDHELIPIVLVERRHTQDRRETWRGGRRDSDWTSRPPGALTDMKRRLLRGSTLARWWPVP